MATQPDQFGTAHVVYRRARMTGLASGLNRAMVHFGYRDERGGTDVTQGTTVARQPRQGRRDMGRMFATNPDEGSRMASFAVHRTDVVECSKRSPAGLEMAGIATRGGRDMIGQRLVIHPRIGTQVAVRTGAGDHPGMGVGCNQRHPGTARTMAYAAGFGSRDMDYRLAGGCRTVMATRTGFAKQLPGGMSKSGGRPGCRAVTRVAGIRRGNVILRFGLSVDAGVGPVVTA